MDCKISDSDSLHQIKLPFAWCVLALFSSCLLVEIVSTADKNVAFKDIDVAILVGAMPRREGMERKDLLKANVKIFKEQGEAIDKLAKKTCKVSASLMCSTRLVSADSRMCCSFRSLWWGTQPTPTPMFARPLPPPFPRRISPA